MKNRFTEENEGNEELLRTLASVPFVTSCSKNLFR